MYLGYLGYLGYFGYQSWEPVRPFGLFAAGDIAMERSNVVDRMSWTILISRSVRDIGKQ